MPAVYFPDYHNTWQWKTTYTAPETSTSALEAEIKLLRLQVEKLTKLLSGVKAEAECAHCWIQDFSRTSVGMICSKCGARNTIFKG